MKSSTRRCSFGSIQSSGLNPSGTFPRGTCAAIWQGRSETLKFSTRAAPDSLARSRRHVASTPQAIGVTMPRPVTTTRLMRSILVPWEFADRVALQSRRGADNPTRQGPDWTPALELKSKRLTRGGATMGHARPSLLLRRRLLKVLDGVAYG